MRAAAMLAAMSCAVLALAACGDEFNDDDNLVMDLRLLAVRAEPAEAAAGERVMLAALAMDPSLAGAGGAPIEVTWMVCTLPPIPGRGTMNPECMTTDLSAAWLVPVGSGLSLAMDVPSIRDEVLGQRDVTGGRYLPVRLRLQTAKQSLDGVYRLRYATETAGAPARNRNPVLTGIHGADDQPLGESTPLSVAAGAPVSLRARFSPDSAEPYTVTVDDGRGGAPREATETLNITWFATAGHFTQGSTGDAGDTVLRLDRNPPAPGATVDVWAVGRDERGGTAWLHRAIVVR